MSTTRHSQEVPGASKSAESLRTDKNANNTWLLASFALTLFTLFIIGEGWQGTLDYPIGRGWQGALQPAPFGIFFTSKSLIMAMFLSAAATTGLWSLNKILQSGKQISKTTWYILCFSSIALAIGYESIRFLPRLEHPQFYAEDCSIFYKQAHDLGIYSIKLGYSGYQHFYQRIVALIAQFFPLRDGPTIFIAAFYLLQLYCWAMIWSKRHHFSTATRVFMTFLVVLAPSDGEVFLNLTNTNWTTPFALILLMTADPAHSKRALIFDSICLCVFIFSGVIGLLLLPIFICRWLLLRWKKLLQPGQTRQLLMYATFALLYATGLIIKTSQMTGGMEGFSSLWLQLTRFTLPTFFGSIHPDIYYPEFAAGGIMSMILLSLLIAVSLLKQSDTNLLSLQLILLYCAVLTRLASIYQGRECSINHLAYYNSNRYMYVPHLCLFWMMAIAVTSSRKGAIASICRGTATALLVIAILFNLKCFDIVKRWPEYDFAKSAQEYETTGKTIVPTPWDMQVPLDKSQRSHPEIPPIRGIGPFSIPNDQCPKYPNF